MKRFVGCLCLVILLITFAACDRQDVTPIPTPKPDPIADINPESGTLGALAFAMTRELGRPVSAGENANQPATGVAAAKLVVTVLGLDLDLHLNAMGKPPSDADYLSTVMQYDIIPTELFTSSAMTAAQIKQFALAVKAASADHIGFDTDSKQWTPATLDVTAEIALRAASLGYNPLAQGRGIFRYAIGMGNEESILYWTLAALGGAKTDEPLAASLPFITINDTTQPTIGTISVGKDDFAKLVGELWGFALPNYSAGLTTIGDRIYLSTSVEDIVRQYPIPYRVERSGDLLRIHADILNYLSPPQYAGKAVIILKEAPGTTLGWQIVSIESIGDPLPQFYEVTAPSTAEGYYALSLIDGNEKTTWQIGNADEETARILLKFSEPVSITGLGIYNGDHTSDNNNLRRNKRAGVVGIRFSEDATKDDRRIDLGAGGEEPMAGFENVLLFGSEITTDTVYLVLYGPVDGHLRISDIRAF